MKLSIAVHNPTLSKIVQQLLFEHGYRWCFGNGGTPQNLNATYLSIGIWSPKEITWGTNHYQDLPRIDAATEMGKLIDLLNEKPAIKIGNYTAEFKDGGVKFGCLFATKEDVLKAKELVSGNAKKDDNLIILGLGSPKLYEIVKALLSSSGITTYFPSRPEAIRIEHGAIQGHDSESYYRSQYRNNTHTFIDAATEFGKLIDLLDNKSATIAGKEATVENGQLKIAGHSVTKETIEEILKRLS